MNVRHSLGYKFTSVVADIRRAFRSFDILGRAGEIKNGRIEKLQKTIKNVQKNIQKVQEKIEEKRNNLNKLTETK